MSQFFQERCTVVDNQRIRDGFFILTLEGPQMAARAAPGQFVGILVPHVEEPPRSYDSEEQLLAEAAGRWPPAPRPLVRRPFSYYDCFPQSGRFQIHGQVVGRGTDTLSICQPGQVLDCLGPLGRPLPLDQPAEWTLLVGGGIGVAPFPYVARQLVARGRKVLALCGARDPELLPLSAFERPEIELPGGSLGGPLLGIPEFEALGVPSAYSLDQGGRIGFKGFVTQLLDDALDRLKDVSVVIHACGPWPMMRATAAVAGRRQLPCWLLLEEFMGCGAGACMSCVVPVGQADSWCHKRVCVEGPAFQAEEIVW